MKAICSVFNAKAVKKNPPPKNSKRVYIKYQEGPDLCYTAILESCSTNLEKILDFRLKVSRGDNTPYILYRQRSGGGNDGLVGNTFYSLALIKNVIQISSAQLVDLDSTSIGIRIRIMLGLML